VIADIVHFYGGGISVSEAKQMPLSELLRHVDQAQRINDAIKEASKDGV